MKNINYDDNKKLIDAKSLRNNEERKKIPKNMPGWYKWWAPEHSLRLLLNSANVSKDYFEVLLYHLTSTVIHGENYYYIYVGVAIKESIHDRLNWHVNQHHTRSSVESGFLSTLRQTISSLISGNQYDEVSTNTFIDSLVIEYYAIELPIKSGEAKDVIECIEKRELNSNALPLNLKDNKNLLLKEYLKEVSVARKNSKLYPNNKE